MSSPAASRLPDRWIGKIFDTLRHTYGASFDRQWECPPRQDPAEFAASLRDHWAAVLGGFANNPDALAYALQHLPEYPPNLMQFQALCRNAPARPLNGLPSHEGTKPSAEVLAKVASVSKRDLSRDARAWAYSLAKREHYQDTHPRDVSSADRLTLAQRHMWRQCLGVELTATAADVLERAGQLEAA